jgi:hypothetical protein
VDIHARRCFVAGTNVLIQQLNELTDTRSCNGCDCGGKNRRRDRDDRPTRYKDNDYQQLPPPNPYAGYVPPSAMAPAPAYRGVPQTATFEDSKGGDSLPAMPSWENATSHRVEVNEPPPKRTEDVEMGRLNPQGNNMYNNRGGYDQIPLSPTSPSGAVPGYFANQSTHSYQSDIGAQRMGPQQTGYSQGFQPSPIPSSPAPTYQTHAHQPSSGDRFMAGAASPSPYQYQHNNSSYAPSSTNYEPSYHDNYAPAPRSNTFSPPPAGTMPSSSSYNAFNSSPAFETQSSPRDARPPSLLQVGRKAVPGSQREI